MVTHLELVDAREAPESTLRAMHQFYVEVDEETLPGDPPEAEAQRIVDWRHHSHHYLERHWLLWENDRIVATSGVEMHLEQDLDNAYGWVHVRKEARGRGLARVVAAPMLDLAEERERTRFAVMIPEGSPYAVIPKRAGMKDAQVVQRSRLTVASIDWDLVQSWMDAAPERASDYELLFRQGRLPEEELEAYCQAHDIMNTAPRDDFERDNEVISPEMWRDWEEMDALRHTEFLIQMARHRSTGEIVGFSELIYQHLDPARAYQADTAVHPDHRDRGLGRWLKAAMLLKLRSEFPDIERIDTHNAGSNEPMLKINIALGFRPVLRQHVWQGGLAALRERLRV